MNNLIDITHPEILAGLWESATFDKSVYKLLEAYTQAQESGSLNENTPQILQLKKDIYHHLTTTRNRNVITDSQQKVLRKAVGGFFGLSTGSHAVATWVMQSRPDFIKIIDPDHISPSNLNRMRFGWDSIGQNKVDAVETEIASISPYTKIIKTTDTDEQTTQELFSGKPKLDFIVEAIDDLKSKVELRLLAKKHKIPLIMATDIGDNVLLDVERYDLIPQPQLFNGLLENIEDIDFNYISVEEKVRLSIKIVGYDLASKEMLDSLLAIGKTIPTWPQLAATAASAGGMVTTIIKKILLREKIKSGRYPISIDKIFDSDFNNRQQIIIRKSLEQKLNRRFQ